MGQLDYPTTWDNLIIPACGFCSVQAEINASITDSTLMHEATEQIGLPWERGCIRSIWSTMGFPAERERDQMYIYKLTYACYNVCLSTAPARPNVYIQIDLCML